MLVDGKLDAALHYITNNNLVDRSRIELEGDPRFRLLFPNPRAEGQRYYQKTRIFGLLGPNAAKDLLVDLYPYGVKSNQKVLDTVAQYSFEQGLTPRVMKMEEIFAPSTLDL